jgi:low affinity Fe/Cu permease
MRREISVGDRFNRVADAITTALGSLPVLVGSVLVVVVWALTGPAFNFSDTWQLFINTGTSLTTFLMVFLIQRAQNKESLAINLKLNEIVAALEGASNRLIDVESLSEDELRMLQKHYAMLVAMAKQDAEVGQSHSVEEAEARHVRKRRKQTDEGQG